MKITIEDNIITVKTDGESYFTINVNIDTIDVSGVYFNKTIENSNITIKSFEKNKIKLGVM